MTEAPLVWLMVLRVVVVSTLLGIAVVAEVVTPSEQPVDGLYFLIALTYLLTLFYALTWPLTAQYRILLAYFQIIGDLLIITGIIYVTGGIDSNFSFLYFITIIAASIILFRKGGLVAAATAAMLLSALFDVLYLGIIFNYLGVEIVPRVTIPVQLVAYTVFLHVFGFFMVAFLTSYLSENLRKTGRKLEEASDFLADLQAFNQTVIDSITSGLMTTDLEGRINFLNNTAAAILAIDPGEAIGRSVVELLGEKQEFMEDVKHKLSGTRYSRMEGSYLNGRGEEIYVGMSVSNLLVQREHRGGFLFIFQDLTDIRKLERQVRLKENLVTMGEMAAGMAHEIRNPLASISGSAQVLRETVELTGEQLQLMGIIILESERLSDTLTEFLSYARPPKFELVQVDLRKLLEETVILLENSAEVLPEHKITLSVPEGSIELFADPNQMKQITWNLARNALQAMPNGGNLDISLARNGNGEVVMTVHDEGVGMTDGEVHEIFDPLTRSFERGGGLGLAIVYRIVKDYNGVIQVDSVASKGTDISVHFPRG